MIASFLLGLAVIAGLLSRYGDPGKRRLAYFVFISLGLWSLYVFAIAALYSSIVRPELPPPLPKETPVFERRLAAEAEYFAVQTLTTTGYGFQLSAPGIDAFYRLAGVAMLLGAVLWAVAISLVIEAFLRKPWSIAAPSAFVDVIRLDRPDAPSPRRPMRPSISVGRACVALIAIAAIVRWMSGRRHR